MVRSKKKLLKTSRSTIQRDSEILIAFKKNLWGFWTNFVNLTEKSQKKLIGIEILNGLNGGVQNESP
jgi:hypothetical protein